MGARVEGHSMQALCVELLGGFAVRTRAGASRTLPSRKARALLAYLALRPGHAYSREQLTALLWGDTPDARARQAFRQALSRLRRGLGPAAGVALVHGPDTVTLDPSHVWVDAGEFETLVGSDKPAALERAAALYRGDLLDGLDVGEPAFEEWRTLERERLRELVLEALTKLLRHQMDADQLDAAVQTALRILALDPLQEAVHRALIRLYARQGRRAAALRQYQECVQSLQRELAAEPEESTRELYRQLVRTAGGGREPGTRSSAPGPAAISAGGGTGVALVGRAAERAALESCLQRALDGGGRVAVISGEAGVGKTRLLEELAIVAAGAGLRVVVGHCFETEQPLPFRPWIDALRDERPALDATRLADLTPAARAQLAGLFSELSAHGSESGIPADDPSALFEAMRELLSVLAAGSPLLLALEDLHWADPMSVRLLAFLGRRLGALPVLLVATTRPEDAVEVPVLERALGELRDARVLDQVPLSPLGPADTLVLARAFYGGGNPAAIEQAVDAVWKLSEGNPFVITESVRALRDGTGEMGELPQSVRETVHRRLTQLSETAHATAITAAVIGHATSFPLLQRASGLAESEAAAAVEELVRRRVLDAVGEELVFCHDRIRQVAYDTVLAPRRVLLHRAVAHALEASGPQRSARDSEWPARARRPGGSGGPARAGHSLSRALRRDRDPALRDGRGPGRAEPGRG